MYTYVSDKIRQCPKCIIRKSTTETKAPLTNITTTKPLELLCIDYLTIEDLKGGVQDVLVVTDHFTRYAQAYPTRNQTARTTADVLFNNFITHYGFPQRLHSDQGANFGSKIIKELCGVAGISKSRTTPYHPMGNGMTERFNRTLLNMLATLTESEKLNWKTKINVMTHAYNVTQHESTGYTPYQLMFGREPIIALDVILKDCHDPESDRCKNYTQYIEDLRKNLNHAYSTASQIAQKSRERQKQNYDLKARSAHLEPGDRVLVRKTALKGKSKLAPKYENRPYQVLDQPNADIPVYTVQDVKSVGKVKTLHRNLLLPIGALPIEVFEDYSY